MKISHEAEAELHRLVPQHLWGGLRRFLEDHVRPGSFLSAALSNDLKDAVATGDVQSLVGLISLVRWLGSYAPIDAWGSRDAFESWLSMNPEDEEQSYHR